MTPSRCLLPALSLTLLISWGSLYYAFAMLAGPLQAELQWSPTQAMGAYSLALVLWGLSSAPVGRLIDRHGGRRVMSAGSLLCGLLLLVLAFTDSLWLFYGVWAGLGAGMALTLYEPAFAMMVEAYPGAHRRPIGLLTLAGGLASTVFWPLTHVLVEGLGWRGTVLVYASVHLFVCAPLHWLLLPAARQGRWQAVAARESATAVPAPSRATQAMQHPAFWPLALSFAAFGFATSTMATHVIPMLEAMGRTPASALAIAALIGPMQVAGRLADLLLAGRLRPLAMGAAAVALMPVALLALWATAAAPGLFYAFAATYGAGLGLLTIVRATTPVELFGTAGYATVSGHLSGPSVLARAAGPLAGAWVLAQYQHYVAVLLLVLACVSAGAASYWLALWRRRK